MNAVVSWWNDHRPSKRRLIQLYSALLYNAHVKGFVQGSIYTGKAKAVCVPGFNCYSCPGAVGACPLGSLQAALASSNQHIGFYMFGILMLYGLIAGRSICGWICPLGFIQELLHKIPTPKLKKSRYTRALSYLKYIILAVFVVAVPMWYGLRHSIAIPGFCKYICPAGTFEGAMGLLSNPANSRFFGMLGILFTRKFVIMLIIGLACIFCYRSFCRFLCPLGAIYGMFSRLAVIGVKVDLGRCNGCGTCVRKCQMDVRHVGDHECIHCAHCMATCPQGAISFKAGKFTVIAPEKGCSDDNENSERIRKKVGKTAWTVAILVLCFALVWFNFLDPAVKEKKSASAPKAEVSSPENTSVNESSETVNESEAMESEEADDPGLYESQAPIGYEPGEQLQDFSAECLDGSTFTLSENRGKVTIINLWATYCGPCVQELPYFARFYHEHEGDVAMIAVHPNFVAQDVGEFVKEKGIDVPVTIDNEDEEIFGIVNGSTTLPQTIVLNRKGEVVYNEIKSVSYELLEQLYEKAK
ncbi:MAG: redoxin family protein [Lachnospiraceae bacterium]|nr:redoxin family protein [Lachnospiraceae bacterium]